MSGGDVAPRMTANVLAFSVDALLGHKTNGSDDTNKPKWTQSPMEGSVRFPLYNHSSEFVHNISNLSYQNEDVQVELCGKELWTQFHRLENEMIITKAGRRMFPALKVKVSGLDPDSNYIFWVDVVSLDENRYRYVYPSSQWMVAGTGDPPMPFNQYIHPDCPSVGRHWVTQFISFDRLKLTNNKQPSIKGQISLHSMHKYQPRIHIQKTTDLQTDPELLIDEKKSLTFVFPETAFITVTAYQNQQITRLKIASNPFAKGFRETVRSRDENDHFDSRGLFPGKPHFSFPGLASVFLPPHSLSQYPYLLSSPSLCTPSFFPYCLMEGCPTTSARSSSHLAPHMTMSPFPGNYLLTDPSTARNPSDTMEKDIRYQSTSPDTSHSPTLSIYSDPEQTLSPSTSCSPRYNPYQRNVNDNVSATDFESAKNC